VFWELKRLASSLVALRTPLTREFSKWNDPKVTDWRQRHSSG
jgi:hypothetical protein